MLEVKTHEELRALCIELRRVGVTKFSIGVDGVAVEMLPSNDLGSIDLPDSTEDALEEWRPGAWSDSE